MKYSMCTNISGSPTAKRSRFSEPLQNGTLKHVMVVRLKNGPGFLNPSKMVR